MTTQQQRSAAIPAKTYAFILVFRLVLLELLSSGMVSGWQLLMLALRGEAVESYILSPSGAMPRLISIALALAALAATIMRDGLKGRGSARVWAIPAKSRFQRASRIVFYEIGLLGMSVFANGKPQAWSMSRRRGMRITYFAWLAVVIATLVMLFWPSIGALNFPEEPAALPLGVIWATACSLIACAAFNFALTLLRAEPEFRED